MGSCFQFELRIIYIYIYIIEAKLQFQSTERLCGTSICTWTSTSGSLPPGGGGRAGRAEAEEARGK